jgi:hypothetical protein
LKHPFPSTGLNKLRRIQVRVKFLATAIWRTKSYKTRNSSCGNLRRLSYFESSRVCGLPRLQYATQWQLSVGSIQEYTICLLHECRETLIPLLSYFCQRGIHTDVYIRSCSSSLIIKRNLNADFAQRPYRYLTFYK